MLCCGYWRVPLEGDMMFGLLLQQRAAEIESGNQQWSLLDMKATELRLEATDLSSIKGASHWNRGINSAASPRYGCP